jgi:hypothetical protein
MIKKELVSSVAERNNKRHCCKARQREINSQQFYYAGQYLRVFFIPSFSLSRSLVIFVTTLSDYIYFALLLYLGYTMHNYTNTKSVYNNLEWILIIKK